MTDADPKPRRGRLVVAGGGVLLLGAALTIGLGGCSGTPPTNLGVRDGRLASPKPSPNCVSSQAPESDQEHHVAPLRYTGSRAAALKRLLSILSEMTRIEVIEQTEDYIRAEATSFLFRFVDDLELYLPEGEALVHVRSASRLGHSDFGVNRSRVEEIRSRFQAD